MEMQTCRICGERRGKFRLIHETDWVSEENIKKAKLGKEEFMFELMHLPKSKPITYVLFDVCDQCLRARGPKVAETALNILERSMAPLGRYQGKPLHEMSKQELADIIRKLTMGTGW